MCNIHLPPNINYDVLKDETFIRYFKYYDLPITYYQYRGFLVWQNLIKK